MKWAWLIAIAACHRREPIASCDQDLTGVYRVDSRERWMVLDTGATLEAYPLFPDADGPLDLVVAPRVLDLERAEPTAMTGTLRRRYMRRADSCEARMPVRVTGCAGDAIEMVLADPVPPTGWEPCTWPRAGSSHVTRWQRE